MGGVAARSGVALLPVIVVKAGMLAAATLRKSRREQAFEMVRGMTALSLRPES
jgi:hypothetical protein